MDKATANEGWETLDDYLRSIPEDHRKALEHLRHVVRLAAPEAVDSKSYGMPALRLDGRPLVAFGAFKDHCSLFPMGSAAIEPFKEELTEFWASKGTLRFSPDKPIPDALITKIVEARVREIRDKKQTAKK